MRRPSQGIFVGQWNPLVKRVCVSAKSQDRCSNTGHVYSVPINVLLPKSFVVLCGVPPRPFHFHEKCDPLPKSVHVCEKCISIASPWGGGHCSIIQTGELRIVASTYAAWISSDFPMVSTDSPVNEAVTLPRAPKSQYGIVYTNAHKSYSTQVL